VAKSRKSTGDVVTGQGVSQQYGVTGSAGPSALRALGVIPRLANLLISKVPVCALQPWNLRSDRGTAAVDRFSALQKGRSAFATC
jgi:hypothetical protein